MYQADNCLEMLQKANSSFPAECKVEKAQLGRPIVRRVDGGTLIVQRSKTPLSITYRSKSIPEEAILLANSKPVHLVFGREKIVIPALGRADDSLVIFTGNFTQLKERYNKLNWVERYYSLIPADLQQIFVLVSLALNGILLILAGYKLMDIIMSYAGYDLLPMHQRRLTKRYILASVVTVEENENIELRSNPGSDVSWNRRQNLRAVERHLGQEQIF